MKILKDILYMIGAAGLMLIGMAIFTIIKYDHVPATLGEKELLSLGFGMALTCLGALLFIGNLKIDHEKKELTSYINGRFWLSLFFFCIGLLMLGARLSLVL